MKTTALVVGAIFGTLLPSTANAGGWIVYTTADASAYSTGAGLPPVHDGECNGTYYASNCADSGAYVGRHSDTKTSARSDANATGFANDTPPYGGPTHGQGYASADLRSGQIHLSSLASAGVNNEQTRGGAFASMIDTLHFTVAMPTSITVKLHIDGDFLGFVQPGFVFGLADGGSLLTVSGRWADSPGRYVNLSSPTVTYTDLGHYGTWASYGPRDFVGSFAVDPLRPEVFMTMNLSAGGSTEYGSTFANFANTAAVSLVLPTGVTFTSDSGAFLTASPSAVPEPATWALLLAGFGAAGVAARRRVVFA